VNELLASIIIDNYNYGRFLSQAIKSALAQTYPNVEIIVVDDGSTDDSRPVIASYDDRIIPVLKANGGQASAFNAGWARCRGEFVCLLDSDDARAPTALAHAVECFADPQVVKMHWLLWVIDEARARTGQIKPGATLAEGDWRTLFTLESPAHTAPPQSGNIWRRDVLAAGFPLPEAVFQTGGADDYLSTLAPLYGQVKRLDEPQGFYRVHARSHYSGKPFLEKLQIGAARYQFILEEAARRAAALGLALDTSAWTQHSWFARVQQSVTEIRALVAPGEAFILLDDEDWGVGPELAGRRRFAFLERDGEYWGAPPDDVTALAELERLRRAGARWLVIVWPAFWWLEQYAEFAASLQRRFRCVLANDRLRVFALQQR
jgi:glycosyltransferase involved in cell wall biosynthesis